MKATVYGMIAQAQGYKPLILGVGFLGLLGLTVVVGACDPFKDV